MTKSKVESTPLLDLSKVRIAKHYSEMMDSVNLIKKGKPATSNNAEWQDRLERNKEHLKIMLAKNFWTDEDMTEIRAVLD